MLLMIGKGIRDGIFHSNIRCSKANNKYIKYFYKNKESSFLNFYSTLVL